MTNNKIIVDKLSTGTFRRFKDNHPHIANWRSERWTA